MSDRPKPVQIKQSALKNVSAQKIKIDRITQNANLTVNLYGSPKYNIPQNISLNQLDQYLESICTKYDRWWELYTLTDVEEHQQVDPEISPPFLDFIVQSVQPTKVEGSETQQKVEYLGVLEGLQKYAPEHVLLVGHPGSGKSTTLARLLLEEAEKARALLNPFLEKGEDSSNSFFKETGGELKIPVLVRLRYYNTSMLEHNTSMLDLICSFLNHFRHS